VPGSIIPAMARARPGSRSAGQRAAHWPQYLPVLGLLAVPAGSSGRSAKPSLYNWSSGGRKWHLRGSGGQQRVITSQQSHRFLSQRVPLVLGSGQCLGSSCQTDALVLVQIFSQFVNAFQPGESCATMAWPPKFSSMRSNARLSALSRSRAPAITRQLSWSVVIASLNIN